MVEQVPASFVARGLFRECAANRKMKAMVVIATSPPGFRWHSEATVEVDAGQACHAVVQPRMTASARHSCKCNKYSTIYHCCSSDMNSRTTILALAKLVRKKFDVFIVCCLLLI